MKLETERLILRPIRNSDAKSAQEQINNLNVSKWLLVVKYPYTLKDYKEWLKISQKKWKAKEKTDYTFGVELKSEKKMIGCFGLHHVDKRQGTATTGYWLGEKYWKKGYGTEAYNAVLDFAFNKLKLRRIEAEVYPGNPSSGKLQKKFGAKLEGYKRKSNVCLADGKIKDVEIYGLLKEEFIPLKK